MIFDEVIDRRGTHSDKWDMMEPTYGVSPDDGLAMWVADMDFRPPSCVGKSVQDMVDHGIFGYYGDYDAYKNAICQWMDSRHGWTVDPSWIFTTHGIVNGTALCVQTWTNPGDGVVVFSPVYHAFARVVKAGGRRLVECELKNSDGRYEMDFAAYDEQMTGSESMVILCSPHNPGGRVWSKSELKEVAAFCVRHDLILVSDEIHNDLVFPGHRHVPLPIAAPDISNRLVMMTAPTKTFNIAGSHCGNVIIEDAKLRGEFAATMVAGGNSPNSFGVFMATAAYSDDGAQWVDDLMRYLDGNRQVFDAGIAGIPGLASMPLEATYLSWVDFSATGMSRDEFTARVEKAAKIVANHGNTFGTGGDGFLRFNIGCARSVINEAVDRLQNAFSDLQ